MAKGFHAVFNGIAGVAAEIAKPTAKAMAKLTPLLVSSGVGIEALPFVLLAATTGSAIGVGLQHISRAQQPPKP